MELDHWINDLYWKMGLRWFEDAGWTVEWILKVTDFQDNFDNDLSEVSQVQGSGIHRKIRAEHNNHNNLQRYRHATKTTTPSRNCCHLIFSSLSSYSTHKRWSLSSCETTADQATFHHRSANSSTMQLVKMWIRNWQPSTFDILNSEAPPCTQVGGSNFSSGGSA